MKKSEKTMLKAWFIQNIIGLGAIVLLVMIEGNWFKVDLVLRITVSIVIALVVSTITGYYYWPYFHKKLKL